MSRYLKVGKQDGGDVGGYVIIEVLMKVYAIGKQRYVVSFNDNENEILKNIRKSYNKPVTKILKEMLIWSFNFWSNSKT